MLKLMEKSGKDYVQQTEDLDNWPSYSTPQDQPQSKPKQSAFCGILIAKPSKQQSRKSSLPPTTKTKFSLTNQPTSANCLMDNGKP